MENVTNGRKQQDEWETNPRLIMKRSEQLKEEAKVAQRACKSSESIEGLVAYVKKTPDPLLPDADGQNPWHAAPGGGCLIV